jgi:hypothetical protein
VVAGCSGTLSFEWMAIIAAIATTAKEQPTTAITRASSSSRPISPAASQRLRGRVLDGNTSVPLVRSRRFPVPASPAGRRTARTP